MNVTQFINHFQSAFTPNAELPIAFWYSDEPAGETNRINGCFFKGFQRVREGITISLSAESIGCNGGKFYTGFIDFPEMIPTFVSLKERYKKTPEMVCDFIQKLEVPRANKPYLNFARIDHIESFEHMEGLLFFATPDILSGLCAWAYFDSNEESTVSAPFGSGCSAVVTQTLLENRKNGKRTFIGLFDPSVRHYMDSNVLSFTIPMSRFKEMYYTMPECCLFNTHGWKKVRERI